MVRELDLSRITLRLVSAVDKKGDNLEEVTRAKLIGGTLDILRRCLYTPSVITMKDKEGHESRVKVSMRFLPVKMTLDSSESFNNQGNLRVEVLDAENLPAADRNGLSDPFCVFHLNGNEVHKTKKQEKTLRPAWNEFFETPVRSRTAGKFAVTVYDWDRAEKDDLLGTAAIKLDVLEPFQPEEVVLKLDGKSGTVRLKMLFKPDYVVRSRQGSSTFSGTFATSGKVVAAPVKGLGKVGTGVRNIFKKKTVNGSPAGGDETVADMRSTSMESPDVSSPPGTSNGPQSHSVNGLAVSNLEPPRTPHQRETSLGSYSQSPAAESGLGSISVTRVTGFESDMRLEVHVFQDSSKGMKEVFKTKAVKTDKGEATYDDTAKKVPCNANSQFKIKIQHHKRIGSEYLGEAPFFINDQSKGGEQDVKVGPGVVTIKTSFEPSDAASLLAPSTSPGGNRYSISRFKTLRGERDATPAS